MHISIVEVNLNTRSAGISYLYKRIFSLYENFQSVNAAFVPVRQAENMRHAPLISVTATYIYISPSRKITELATYEHGINISRRRVEIRRLIRQPTLSGIRVYLRRINRVSDNV